MPLFPYIQSKQNMCNYLLRQYKEVLVLRYRLEDAHTHTRRKQWKEVAQRLKQQHWDSNLVLHNRESDILILCNERIPFKRIQFAI